MSAGAIKEKIEGYNYLTTVDISANTNLAGGTNITLTGSTFNLTVAGAANWNNTGKVTETFLASQKTNITGDLDLDTSLSIDIDALTFITVDADTTIDTVAGTVFTIESGGGNGNASATNKVDINPPS